MVWRKAVFEAEVLKLNDVWTHVDTLSNTRSYWNNLKQKTEYLPNKKELLVMLWWHFSSQNKLKYTQNHPPNRYQSSNSWTPHHSLAGRWNSNSLNLTKYQEFSVLSYNDVVSDSTSTVQFVYNLAIFIRNRPAECIVYIYLGLDVSETLWEIQILGTRALGTGKWRREYSGNSPILKD